MTDPSITRAVEQLMSDPEPPLTHRERQILEILDENVDINSQRYQAGTTSTSIAYKLRDFSIHASQVFYGLGRMEARGLVESVKTPLHRWLWTRTPKGTAALTKAKR